jgi:hypothetical protein
MISWSFRYFGRFYEFDHVFWLIPLGPFTSPAHRLCTYKEFYKALPTRRVCLSASSTGRTWVSIETGSNPDALLCRHELVGFLYWRCTMGRSRCLWQFEVRRPCYRPMTLDGINSLWLTMHMAFSVTSSEMRYSMSATSCLYSASSRWMLVELRKLNALFSIAPGARIDRPFPNITLPMVYPSRTRSIAIFFITHFNHGWPLLMTPESWFLFVQTFIDIEVFRADHCLPHSRQFHMPCDKHLFEFQSISWIRTDTVADTGAEYAYVHVKTIDFVSALNVWRRCCFASQDWTERREEGPHASKLNR